MEISAGLGNLHEVNPGLRNVTYFSNSPLDRQSELRKDSQFILDCLKSEKAVYLLCSNQMPLTKELFSDKIGYEFYEGSYQLMRNFSLSTLTFSQVKKLIPTFGTDLEKPLTIYLGCNRSQKAARSQWFAVDVTGMEIDNVLGNEFPNYAFRNPRPCLLMLSAEDAAIAAQARSILSWHERYSFCSTCGSGTSVLEGGYKRWCSNEHCSSRKGVSNTCFPRLDPVVIMVVTSPDNNKLLLGRKAAFTKDMYSCLAGFMEPGETIEEAVRREVYEESGILVGKVTYRFSQPWPFPSVLMIGCVGEALTEEITVCKEELDDAKWFSKYDVCESLTAEVSSGDSRLMVPPGQTIAHQLLKRWCEENEVGSLQSRI